MVSARYKTKLARFRVYPVVSTDCRNFRTENKNKPNYLQSIENITCYKLFNTNLHK